MIAPTINVLVVGMTSFNVYSPNIVSNLPLSQNVMDEIGCNFFALQSVVGDISLSWGDLAYLCVCI